MDIETKMELALRPPTEELISHEELRSLFETNSKPTHYVGYELSGMLHIGHLVMAGNKIRDLQKAGVHCIVFLADWHSIMNEKFGGNWQAVQQAAAFYSEAFRAYCPGVETILGSDLYHNNDDYWKTVMEFSRRTTLARATRCLTIMGRSEKDRLSVAQYIYPSMQGADIKFLGADIAHAGMDQRKVHMLAREVFPSLGWKKPIALHNHLLCGLAEPEPLDPNVPTEEQVAVSKMSKSKPWTAIFIMDSKETIEEKMKKAYCPAKVAENNPLLEYAKYLAFREPGDTLKIERPAKFGGPMDYASYSQLEKDFVEGKLHPMDLKSAMAGVVNRILEPLRSHLEKKPELLKVFETTKVTR